MKSFLIILTAAVLFSSCAIKRSENENEIKLDYSTLFSSKDFKFTEAKLSADNRFLAAATDSPGVTLKLIKRESRKVIFSFNRRAGEFIFTARNNLLFLISEYLPDRKNILYYYNIKTDSLIKILSASSNIHSLGIIDSGFIFTINDSVKIYDERNLSETGSTKEFSYSFISGNSVITIRNGKTTSEKKKEQIIWRKYAGGALVYYLKRSGLFVEFSNGKILSLGNIMYPELNRDGKYLLGIEEKYDGQKMINSRLLIFRITANDVLPTKLFVDNAYSPHWNADGNSITYIANDGSIKAAKLILEKL